MENGYIPPSMFKEMGHLIAPHFHSATVVDLSNVARYYFAGTDQEYWEPARDFPAIRSPFDLAWYEYSHNGFVRSAERGDHWEPPITVGFLMRVFERGDYRQVFDCDIVEEYKSKIGVHIEPRWVQEGLLFLQDAKNKPAAGPVAAFRFPVKHDGSVCVRDDNKALFEVLPFTWDGDDLEAKQQFRMSVETIIYPVLLGITFMHTTNVKQVNHTPPDKPNRKRLKSGRPPLTEYKTLELSLGAGKTTADFGASGRDYYGRKLHLVRGGFRNYTKERPLFGKHVGRWFWKPHVRGDAEVGEVKKDYKIGE